MNGLHPALFDTVARQWEYGRLKELNLRGLGITTLPSEICSLSYLANLDISYNNLQSLPAEIVQLCLISTYTTCDSGCTFNCCRTVVTNGLSIRNNGLCTVPKAIGDWIDLHFGGKNYLARDSTQRCGSQ
jgi:Leucine-rich repeat (LRR) protein